MKSKNFQAMSRLNPTWKIHRRPIFLPSSTAYCLYYSERDLCERRFCLPSITYYMLYTPFRILITKELFA